ncbi:hypothetical protein K450DRAFT_231201 [Umbelopsis ramanniana AG]|uniref:Actin-related protein 5 n=1 Tax=Umbelopsis ramanniana AG TaxID=1314678 RepID=A0AAD5HGI4_UMBRA|nr:uncharacterized protein K450DRAFT_231201 [Umbelopsis ramanniana AG]KAI8581791.1 hypothetical protein K450DRAFT_231201 [Umbelopsis ramanniana AG]
MEDDDFIEQPIYAISEKTSSTQYSPSTDYRSKFKGSSTPIVIDNGSYNCRAGWGSEKSPRFVFDNLVARYRDRKNNVSVVAVGPEIYADPAAKATARSPFDSNVVCDMERMEHVLDYIFLNLGIDTPTIGHPILMTEPACVPKSSRKMMTELLFECYSVPSVSYGIDSLFSFYANQDKKNGDGIVISAGHTATHIIPVIGGKGALDRTKRLSYGGTQASEYMLKLMQLKYPTFPTKVTSAQAQQLMHEHIFVAEDYQQILTDIENRQQFQKIDRIVQFPFSPLVVETKTEEELARQAARKEENAKRLREAAAKSRLEKLVQREQQHEAFTVLKEMKGTVKKVEWLAQLKESGFDNEADLDATIKKLEEGIQRARNKELGIDENDDKPPTFPLLDIPDDQLSEADKKEKKKQRLLKAGYDARQRAKKAKEEDKARQAEIARLDEERRMNHPDEWLSDLKEKRKATVERIKTKKRLASELADRRSHASQLRMRSIASLASDTPASKRRKRGAEEDTFGADDEDWMVYREINREEESEDEEEDMASLNHYESLLLQHDPDFLPEHAFEAEQDPTNTLLHLLKHGMYPKYDAQDVGQSHQLHVNVERVRVPEVLFQPSIIGLDQAGLVDNINDIVRVYDASRKQSIVKNVFVTGGFGLMPGLAPRLEKTFQENFNVGWNIRVKTASNPTEDAWRGAAEFSMNDEFSKLSISKAEYEEYGGEYIKEHGLGNVFRSSS